MTARTPARGKRRRAPRTDGRGEGEYGGEEGGMGGREAGGREGGVEREGGGKERDNTRQHNVRLVSQCHCPCDHIGEPHVRHSIHRGSTLLPQLEGLLLYLEQAPFSYHLRNTPRSYTAPPHLSASAPNSWTMSIGSG